MTDETADKGLLEVIAAGQSAAECQILQRTDREILVDDQVASPVFRPGRRITFYVFGAFDLDGDGRADRRGAARVRQMIERWGGRVVDEPAATVDCAVLGDPPPRPSPPPAGADEGTWRRHQLAVAQRRGYDEQLAVFNSSHVPVLNQNRFLDLVGGAR